MASMATALITGGTGGLGVSVVEAFLADGWRVVVPDVSAGRARAAPAEAEFLEADLTDPDDVARVVRTAAGEDGRAAARASRTWSAGSRPGRTWSTRRWRTSRRCSRSTCARPTSSPRPRCRGWSRRAAARSSASRAAAALEPWAGGAGYAASKAAVLAFARTVAKEHADEGVRCNVIAPSLIDTPANRASSPDAIDKMVPPERIAEDDPLPVQRRRRRGQRRRLAGLAADWRTVKGMAKWWTLVAVCVATFMLLLDITVVNVALPYIERDLGSLVRGPAVGDRRLHADARGVPADGRLGRRPAAAGAPSSSSASRSSRSPRRCAASRARR